MKKITIGLLSHLYDHENLGCVALSISNLTLIDKAAELSGIDVEYKILVTDKIKQVSIPYTNNKYEYVVFPSCKQTIKNPLKFLRGDFYKDCDIVFNISGGDGFTDIYGFKRTLAESYMTILASMKKIPVVFCPQTIGPFHTRKGRIIGKRTLKNVKKIFTRDQISTKVCEKMGYSKKTTEVIDVAFNLPYKNMYKKTKNKKIGINVSGLLYNGGYDRNNYFKLSFDYKKFIERIIEELIKKDYEIHLISHVNSEENTIEDDYTVCKELSKKYKVILAPKYKSPIDIKSYISGMDVFSGARMHSTIGAFSVGIPTIPIAYSKKFNGLYNTLNYPFYIDAKSTIELDEAVKTFMEFIEKENELKKSINKSKIIYEERLNKYLQYLEDLFENEKNN